MPEVSKNIAFHTWTCYSFVSTGDFQYLSHSGSSSFNRDRLNRPSFMDEWDRNLPEPTPPSRQSFDEWKRNNLPDRPKSTPPKRPEGSDFLDDWRRSRAETSKSSNTPHSSSDNEEGNFDKYAWVGGWALLRNVFEKRYEYYYWILLSSFLLRTT